MNAAQVFHADLDTPSQLVVFFAAAAVTAVLLSFWSTLTRAITRLARGQR
jgi:hypothetical protein